MPKTRIEVVALDGTTFYSICKIEVTSLGEVYAILKTNPPNVSKISRHISGETHVYSKVYQKKLIYQGLNLEEFTGIEHLNTFSINIETLDKIFAEYQLKKSDGIFCIDLRHYKNATLNLRVSILS